MIQTEGSIRSDPPIYQQAVIFLRETILKIGNGWQKLWVCTRALWEWQFNVEQKTQGPSASSIVQNTSSNDSVFWLIALFVDASGNHRTPKTKLSTKHFKTSSTSTLFLWMPTLVYVNQESWLVRTLVGGPHFSLTNRRSLGSQNESSASKMKKRMQDW